VTTPPTTRLGDYCFLRSILFKKSNWAHFTRKEIFFLKSTIHYSNNLLLRYRHWSTVNYSGIFPTGRRRQASLVKEAQDDMLYHNTWSSWTSCGGINLYTLMGRHGPHHQRWLGPQDGRRAPQDYKILYQIGYFTYNSVPSRYIRRGRGPLEDRSEITLHLRSIQSDLGRMYYAHTAAEPG